MSKNQNPRNSFVIDEIDKDDPDRVELENLQNIRKQIARKKRELKQRNFDKKHPAVAAARDRLYAAQATPGPGLKTEQKIKLVIQKPITEEEIIHTERSEPEPPQPTVAPVKVETEKPQFELGGQPIKVEVPKPAAPAAPVFVRPVNGKWF